MLAQAAPATARAVEAQLLPEATGPSLGRLKARTLELLLELDADAVDARRKEAKRRADVRAYPSPLEGMSTLAADLPAPVTADCFDVVDQLAAMLKADGDPRPIGELRAAVLAELIRRPWDTRLPAITARLHVTAQLSSLAGHSTEPGDVSGQPITARHLRELVAQSGFLGLQTPECGSLTFGITDADGRLPATASGSTLERLARRGCAQHADGDCRCSSLGRPAPTAGYSPTRAQGDWVRTRDRTCRFPHCGQRAGWTDLDHVVPHSCGGETDCTNLCCLCRSHHRLKTFAPGWQFRMDADGVLHVTTPSGDTRITRPAGLRPLEPPGPVPEQGVARGPEPGDDPLPF